MQDIAIIYKDMDTKALALIPHLQSHLEKHGYTVLKYPIDTLPPLEGEQDMILLALGGDGTILSLAHKNYKARYPIISINTGRVGFLTTCSLEHWKELLIPALLNYELEHFPLIHITAQEHQDIAINEISITRNGIARNIIIDVTIDQEFLYSLTGDGLLLATQYGSSAYARSVGGSLIHPKLEAFVIAPIISSTPPLPPIIIPNSSTIDIHIQAHDASITCDGQRLVPFSSHITLQLSPYTIPFIAFCKQAYYTHLRKKRII